MEKATKIIRLVTVTIMAVCAGLDLAKRIKEHVGDAVQDAKAGSPLGNLFDGVDLSGLEATLRHATARDRHAEEGTDQADPAWKEETYRGR